DPEVAVDAHVDTGRLEQSSVVRVDLDPPFLEQPPDRHVGENHASRFYGRPRGYREGVAATRAIDLTTAIPGPLSREILARKERVVAEPLSLYLPIVIAEGRGATLTDVDGNTFLDFTGGVGCLNVGHSHPRVVAAAQEQLERFSHTDFTIVPYEVYVSLAERLTKLAPIGGETRAAFLNAGPGAAGDAVELARA